ncbi:hypothetical protein B0H10DRAFT_2237103 [Mycena sp. CBHHK59/15]|nr:hypothetical protein B0H10DRAFT_2237103 [Mycena sp. CBHHK59/15]
MFGWSSPRVASGSAPVSDTPPRRTQSMPPPDSSPLSSVIDATPVKNPRGHPAHTPETRNLTSTMRRLATAQDTPSRGAYKRAEAELARKKTEAAATRAQATEAELAHRVQRAAEATKAATALAAVEKKVADTLNTRKAHQVIADLTKPTEEGG